MGQYYRAYVQPSEAGLDKAEIFKLDGFKLMEHSWLGNTSVCQVMAFLAEHPSKVAWIGDYAMDWMEELSYFALGMKNEIEEKCSSNGFEKCYNYTWGKKGTAIAERHKAELDAMSRDEARELCKKMENAYIVNVTQHWYISLKEYEELHWKEFKQKGEKRKDHWCEHPLPLLTACGNGQGGGDFYKEGYGCNDIGTQAFDVFRVDFERPVRYLNATEDFLFSESEY